MVAKTASSWPMAIRTRAPYATGHWPRLSGCSRRQVKPVVSPVVSVDLPALARWQRVAVGAWAPAAFALAAARLLLFLTVACNLEPATVFQQ